MTDHGITSEEYQAILERQGGGCAICKEKSRKLCVDRVPPTGNVSGLLCRSCQIFLECFNYDADLIRRAYDYWLAGGDYGHARLVPSAGTKRSKRRCYRGKTTGVRLPWSAGSSRPRSGRRSRR